MGTVEVWERVCIGNFALHFKMNVIINPYWDLS